MKLILQAAHKVISPSIPEIPSLVSLAVIVVVLAASIGASLRRPAGAPAEPPRSEDDRVPTAERGSLLRRASLSEPAVDALAEQVGVAVVPGVLLDHVDEQFAQRDRLPVAGVPTKSRSWSRMNSSANAHSSRHAAHASSTTAGSGTAPLKSPSGSSSVW